MNKNIKLAVAGAVLALSASANAGIVIPAGDWTLDVNGNVNAFANWTKFKGDTTAITGGINGTKTAIEDTTQGINTGLLPAWLGFTGKTRQNDVDVEFTISFQPHVSDQGGAVHGDSKTPLNRQAYVSFGDKSWGSVKLGKDIGVFADEAILNDMTLLGVGAGAANSGGATTLGGIGTGYIYAAWKGQIAYTTPNFNGFKATVAIVNPNQIGGGDQAHESVARTLYQDRFGLEGKATYSFAGEGMSGKVWVSGASYDVTYNASTGAAYTISAADIGANLNAGNFGLTAYYYTGDGLGTTLFGANGATSAGLKRNSDGGYVQGTYILPTKTKLGLAYGTSRLDPASGETGGALVKENDRITVGLYHPLTKHLNLVAEYNDVEAQSHNGLKNEARTGSLGAILFF